MSLFVIDKNSLKTICPKVRKPQETKMIKSDLSKKGYTVVNVMAFKAAKHMLNSLKAWLEGLDPRVSTSKPTDAFWPDNILGIIKSYGVGQAEFMWQARLNNNILHVFSQLWGCKPSQLVTSFDGACYYPKAFAPEGGKFKLWPHCDQSPKLHMELQCYQGLLSLSSNVNKHDGGFVVWPRSHKQYMENGIDVHSSENFYQLHAPTGSINVANARRIVIPPGSFVLWDSRTFHCNSPPLDPMQSEDRAALYICMLPRSRCSQETLNARYQMFKLGRTTSHHPDKPVINPDIIRYKTACQLDPSRAHKMPFLNKKSKMIRSLVPFPTSEGT